MKIKTLIQKLSKMNPEAEVRINDYDGDVALFVNARLVDKNVVWIDGEHDFNLKEELSTRFEKAEDEQLDELDFYRDLLEIGITIDMVRKYMGDSYADTMKKFCEEHGLE